MNYISANLMGGLGNQMFQIAHALAQGRRYGVPCEFYNKAYTPMQARQTSVYQDNIFKNISFNRDKVGANWLGVSEDMMCFFPDLSNVLENNSVEFNGYFQGEEHFLGHSEYIRSVFGKATTPEFRLKTIDRYNKVFKEKKVVSVHVRRGDYFTISNILPVVDKSYLDAAIPSYDHLLIFSDDKEWVKTLSYPNSTVVEDLEDYEEIWLMSMCDEHVISNSSFGWWGSFLNDKPNKKTYVPSMWFGPGEPKTGENMYRKDMTIIPVEYKEGFLHAKSL